MSEQENVEAIRTTILRDVAPHLLDGDAHSQASCIKTADRGNFTRASTKVYWRFRYTSEPKWQVRSRSEIVVEFVARATQVWRLELRVRRPSRR